MADTPISCLSTQWTAELFRVLGKADAVVNADIVANMSHFCQTLNGLVDGAQIQDMQLGAFRDNPAKILVGIAGDVVLNLPLVESDGRCFLRCETC